MPVGERYVTEGVRVDCELIGGIELYLIAFVQLRSVFTSRELNELGDSMAERGIRLREGLDEALEGFSLPGCLRSSKREVPAVRSRPGAVEGSGVSWLWL